MQVIIWVTKEMRPHLISLVREAGHVDSICVRAQQSTRLSGRERRMDEREEDQLAHQRHTEGPSSWTLELPQNHTVF